MAVPASTSVQGECACDADRFDSPKDFTDSEFVPAGDSTFQLSLLCVQLSSDLGCFIN